MLEINQRVLYADYGHSTLQKYMMKELGYSEGESWIRIQAMKLIRTSASAKQKIESGALSLSNAAVVQKHLQECKVRDATKIEESINLGTNRSNRDLRIELDKIVGREVIEKKVILKKSILDKIQRLNKLLASEMTELELFEALLDEKIRKQELKSEENSITCEKGRVTSDKHIRYIPVQVKRLVAGHAAHQCEYKDKKGICCSERRYLQFDHIKPFALGGTRTSENIQLLCSAHNQRRKFQTFGQKGQFLSKP